MKPFAGRAFVFGTRLVLVVIVLQVFLAGLGVFASPRWFFWHANVNGAVVFFLPLLVVLVGWYAGVPVRIRWMVAAVSGLVVVQSLLLIPYHMAATGALRAISALHVPNAIFIFWVAFQIVERTRAWSQRPQPVPAPGP